MRRGRSSGAILVWVGLSVVGCDGGGAGASAGEAKAPATKKANDEAVVRRKAEREAEQKAKAEAAAELEATIDALAVLPEDVPKSLPRACKQMSTAYDAYMRKVLTGDMLTKWETGGNADQITIFERECKKRTPKIAACQTAALQRMSPELEKELPAVMKRCAEKFAEG